MLVGYQVHSSFKGIPQLRAKVSSFVSRQARDFKNLTKRRIVESRPAGRLYARRSGPEFRRFHRASAKGQRPAIDTGRLLNSIESTRLTDLTYEVSVGVPYAGYLQNPMILDRQIFRAMDITEAQLKMSREAAMKGIF